jgi:hypothetical protein
MTRYFDFNFKAFENRVLEALDCYQPSALTDWLNDIYVAVQNDTAALSEIALVGDLKYDGQWIVTEEFINRLGHLLVAQGKRPGFFF